MLKKTVLLLLLVSCTTQKTPTPPETVSIPATDIYHGVSITDPYRNLENLKDSTVIDWFKNQDQYAKEILTKIPGRQRLLDIQLKLDERQAFSIQNIATQKDGSLFYLKRSKNETINKLCYRSTKNKSEKLIYDPTLFKEGYIINYFKVNWQGTKVAISLAKKGENISNIIIFDLLTHKRSPYVLQNTSPNSEGGIHWLPDGSGIIYQYIPYTDHQDKKYKLDTRAVLYKLGEAPEKITDVFSRRHNPSFSIQEADFPTVFLRSNNPSYIFGKISGSSKYNDHYYAKINSNTNFTKLDWKPLFSKNQKIEQFVVVQDELIYRTSKNASNYKICKTSIQSPNFDNPIEIVPQQKDKVIRDFEFENEQLFYTTLKNGIEANLYVLKNEKENEIQLPFPAGSCYISSYNGYFTVSIRGWTKPNKIFYLDTNTHEFSEIDISGGAKYPEFNDFIVEEIEIPSHDNVKVPLSIIYKKGLKKDGKNPLISLSYGSYGASFSPYFSIPFLTWVLEGGVWVIPHVRGGGEKGDAWYKAGFKTTKPNTWKDLIACTQYLIDNKYTSPEYNIAYGVSAAGIAVGRSITDSPELFAAATMEVPALNFLRCEIQPNGPNSIKEFGTVKDSVEFRALLEMDSYHHIKSNTNYPAILITTGMKDGSVVPWDPAKFVARMQASSTSGKPVIFSVDFNANHQGDGTYTKYYRDMSDIMAFALWQIGHPEYQSQ
ncbi:prolyl oligopeptidase family serine peptidase [Aquimarina sp. D1M17]|uniref:prolyl oligopeptidase family serine peptidase n=1 Tax=Aquimarina acroporae TaxID=2937283 RepID=UPI0020BE0073|nr:prolyl oligopeptidase family serine peptidase [Aquimarina acroporae]MCK8523052.1 prolyl oligopeptidase family serine peptidase [Aquimarina acroporae]